jgi:chemosensory pili system protein ChpE
MTLLFCSVFIAGLAYCAAPGVINAEGIRRGISHGFRACMLFQIGTLVGNVFWAIIALSGLAVLPTSAEARFLLGMGGGLFMLWMAWGILCEARHGQRTPVLRWGSDGVLLGAALSLANPFAILFWLGMGGILLATNLSIAPLLTAVIVISAFLVAKLLWSLLLATLTTCGRTLVGGPAFRWINAGAGVAIAICGICLCWQSLVMLLQFSA